MWFKLLFFLMISNPVILEFHLRNDSYLHFLYSCFCLKKNSKERHISQILKIYCIQAQGFLVLCYLTARSIHNRPYKYICMFTWVLRLISIIFIKKKKKKAKTIIWKSCFSVCVKRKSVKVTALPVIDHEECMNASAHCLHGAVRFITNCCSLRCVLYL